eukprot:5506938-Prymnesium_polylepis.1
MALCAPRALCTARYVRSRAPHVLRRDVASEEVVDAVAHAGNLRDDAVCARLAVEAADVVGHVVEDGEVVLDHDHVPRATALVALALLLARLAVGILVGAGRRHERADDVGRGHALPHVEERAGLVEH